jgi:hypothetical protein
MRHARLPRAVRLLHQASSSGRAGAGSRGWTSPVQDTPNGSVILRVTPAATSSSPGSSPNRWAVSQSFRWSFRQALHHTTAPYQLNGSSNLTSWNGTQQHDPDGRGSTSNPPATTKVPIADDLGRLVGWVEARSARRSVRGGQNFSTRRVGLPQNLTERHPVRDPRTSYLSRYARFGVACSPSVVEDGCCGGLRGAAWSGPGPCRDPGSYFFSAEAITRIRLGRYFAIP